MSSEIVPKNVFDIVESQKKSFNDVLSNDSIAWARESQFAVQQLQSNSFLNTTAWGAPDSLKNAIVNVAAIGISLNPANKHAYLVPRKPAKDQKTQICLDISYMGLKHLAEKSGSILWVQAKLVYENDKYTNNGVDKEPTHKQNTFGEKGNVVGAYCTVKIPNGDYLTEEMNINQLNEVRAKSKAANGPWKDFTEEMMRKTVVKRAAKYWPSPKGEMNTVNKAIEVINEHEGLEQPDLYTEEEQKEFMRMINDEIAFSLSAFMADSSDEKQTSLFNSFPKNYIASNKKKVRSLQAVGFEEWQSFTENVRELIKNEDVNSLNSELLGFEPYEKRMLANQLGEHDTNRLSELLKGGQND
jgi:recombination protein RecT